MKDFVAYWGVDHWNVDDINHSAVKYIFTSLLPSKKYVD